MHMLRLEKMRQDPKLPRKNISPNNGMNPMNNGSEGPSRFLTSKIQAQEHKELGNVLLLITSCEFMVWIEKLD